MFQSTRPVRGATKQFAHFLIRQRVSIHAPRAGRDYEIKYLNNIDYAFQSTRPVRGAT